MGIVLLEKIHQSRHFDTRSLSITRFLATGLISEWNQRMDSTKREESALRRRADMTSHANECKDCR